jgi:hypothetical protein
MKRRIIQPWTPEDDDRLRRLAAEGRTSVTIAERMKRTPASVRSRTRAIKVVLMKGEGTTRRPITLASSERLQAPRGSALARDLGSEANGKGKS